MKTIAVIIAVSLPMLVHAQVPVTPRVDQRQANQQARIDQGVQSGALTGQEAARLERGQDRMGRMEDKAKADGTVTGKERARLHQAQDRQSARIYRQKHDAQTDRNKDGKVDRPKRKRPAQD